MNSEEKDLVIGLDMGTSSIKLVILNIKTNKIEMNISASTNSANLKLDNKDYSEQNVDIILSIVNKIFQNISKEYLKRLRGVQL